MKSITVKLQQEVIMPITSRNFIKSPAPPAKAMKSRSRGGIGGDMSEGELNQRFMPKMKKPKPLKSFLK